MAIHFVKVYMYLTMKTTINFYDMMTLLYLVIKEKFD